MLATTRQNAPVAKAVSGVRAVSTSFEKIQRWPAAMRRSSRGLSRSSGNASTLDSLLAGVDVVMLVSAGERQPSVIVPAF